MRVWVEVRVVARQWLVTLSVTPQDTSYMFVTGPKVVEVM